MKLAIALVAALTASGQTTEVTLIAPGGIGAATSAMASFM